MIVFNEEADFGQFLSILALTLEDSSFLSLLTHLIGKEERSELFRITPVFHGDEYEIGWEMFTKSGTSQDATMTHRGVKWYRFMVGGFIYHKHSNTWGSHS